MRIRTFSARCAKEILRDPINLGFGLGFPCALLLLLSAIQRGVPVDLFRIESLAPGVAVFGLSFMTLFSATLVAKDRESSLLARLYTTPMRPYDFILGYMIPLIPISLAQSAVSYLVSIALGLPVSVNILSAMLALIPTALLYIGLGLLCGSIFTSKQVGGICGALLTNLSAWLSGVWFDLELVGGAFRSVAELLPFVHAVELSRSALLGDTAGLWHAWPVLGYALSVTAGAVILFLRQMKKR